MYMSVTIALKPLDTFSWSTVEGLGVNQKTESHTTTCGFDLHISKFQFKTEKQQCLSHLLPRVSLFLSRPYLLSNHITDLIFLPSPHWNP